MNVDPQISVVLATYNRLASLPRTVESVLGQQGVSFELIAVDDASTDGSADYLRTLGDPRVRVIAAPRNLGPGGARNLGIAAAQAELVAFIDSDDVYLPDRLAAPYAILARDPDLVCTLSSSIRVFPDKRRTSILPDVTLSPPAFRWTLLCALIGSETSSVTARRAAARAVGGFRPELRHSEDREFLARLAAHGPARLISAVHWEKSWSADGLSNYADAAPALQALLEAHSETFRSAPKLMSYLAARILVRDLRAGRWSAFRAHLRWFRKTGLTSLSPAQLLRDYRVVSRYRRTHLNSPAIVSLTGPPPDWT